TFPENSSVSQIQGAIWFFKPLIASCSSLLFDFMFSNLKYKLLSNKKNDVRRCCPSMTSKFFPFLAYTNVPKKYSLSFEFSEKYLMSSQRTSQCSVVHWYGR